MRLFLKLLLLAVILFAGYLGYTYWYIHRYDTLIKEISLKYKLDSRLIFSIVYEESYFNPNAYSRAKAIGLMQITPIVVQEWEESSGSSKNKANFNQTWAHKTKLPYEQAIKLSTEDLLKYPEINLHIGCWYLSQLRQRFDKESYNLAVTLAGYNAGPTHAERWVQVTQKLKHKSTEDDYIKNIDYPETQTYVSHIIKRYKKTSGVFDF